MTREIQDRRAGLPLQGMPLELAAGCWALSLLGLVLVVLTATRIFVDTQLGFLGLILMSASAWISHAPMPAAGRKGSRFLSLLWLTVAVFGVAAIIATSIAKKA